MQPRYFLAAAFAVFAMFDAAHHRAVDLALDIVVIVIACVFILRKDRSTRKERP